MTVMASPPLLLTSVCNEVVTHHPVTHHDDPAFTHIASRHVRRPPCSELHSAAYFPDRKSAPAGIPKYSCHLPIKFAVPAAPAFVAHQHRAHQAAVAQHQSPVDTRALIPQHQLLTGPVQVPRAEDLYAGYFQLCGPVLYGEARARAYPAGPGPEPAPGPEWEPPGRSSCYPVASTHPGRRCRPSDVRMYGSTRYSPVHCQAGPGGQA